MPVRGPGNWPAVYEVCGLRMVSNHPLPWLSPVRGRGPVDVMVHCGRLPDDLALTAVFESAPWWESCQHGPDGQPLLCAWWQPEHNRFILRWNDGAVFVVRADGSHMWVSWPPGYEADQVLACYFPGNILSFLLRLRGAFCLHASAVVSNGRALIFAGPPGAGKSTLAAALVHRGTALLADDLVALRPAGGALLAWPGIPQLNLWPAAARQLLGPAARLPRLFPQEDKRCLRAGRRVQFARQPAPVGAVYLLEASPATDRPEFEAVTGSAAAALLLGHGFGIQPPGAAPRELAMVAELARGPVRRLRRPQRLETLEELARAVEADAAGLFAAAPASAELEVSLAGAG